MDALFHTLDQGLGANGRLIASWRDLRAIGQDVNRIVRQALIPAFGALWVTVGLGSPVMRVLIAVLGFVSRHTTALKVALVLLTAWFVYTRTATLLFRVATRLTGVEMLAFTGITAKSSAAVKYYTLWTYRAEAGSLALKRTLLLLRGIGPIALTIALSYELDKHKAGLRQWARKNVPGVRWLQDTSSNAPGGAFFDRINPFMSSTPATAKSEGRRPPRSRRQARQPRRPAVERRHDRRVRRQPRREEGRQHPLRRPAGRGGEGVRVNPQQITLTSARTRR
jgi:hypothetical protein